VGIASPREFVSGEACSFFKVSVFRTSLRRFFGFMLSSFDEGDGSMDCA
jgi:hypothetical protein